MASDIKVQNEVMPSKKEGEVVQNILKGHTYDIIDISEQDEISVD